ncbi:MAG: hypothetical protein E6487_22050 [Bacteroides sp.]|nr:hypothetical protein [Bacteroides sp.]
MDDKKCWGQRSRPALFFSGQRAKIPATSDRGERVSNGLPGQTVKGRDCNTEEGGCFGNAEAPDDDHCNPAHVWNFSFPVYP